MTLELSSDGEEPGEDLGKQHFGQGWHPEAGVCMNQKKGAREKELETPVSTGRREVEFSIGTQMSQDKDAILSTVGSDCASVFVFCFSLHSFTKNELPIFRPGEGYGEGSEKKQWEA